MQFKTHIFKKSISALCLHSFFAILPAKLSNNHGLLTNMHIKRAQLYTIEFEIKASQNGISLLQLLNAHNGWGSIDPCQTRYIEVFCIFHLCLKYDWDKTACRCVSEAYIVTMSCVFQLSCPSFAGNNKHADNKRLYFVLVSVFSSQLYGSRNRCLISVFILFFT